MDCVRIHRHCGCRVRVAKPFAYVGYRHSHREQVRPWEWHSVCRLAPFGSLSLRQSNETAAETESGLSGEPLGLAKIRFSA